ncbi:hypothetical protein [Krasilnikovia sp. MM14-A1004]|uniref:hypothetical protein n=1 Tax=Krasilnikovia sp. MM14-A1004 TaxID=3373541 RepID=UPI00399D36E2
MRRLVILLLVPIVLGWAAYRVFLVGPNEDEDATRPPTIVVVTKGEARAEQETVIGATLQHTSGVARVRFVDREILQHQLRLADQDIYFDLFDGLPPDSYELTTRDPAAHEALENGSFKTELLALPGVAAVYFGCTGLITCTLRERTRSSPATHPAPSAVHG